MRASKQELPVAEDYGEGFISRQVEWGGMIVEISSFPEGSTPHLSSRVYPTIGASPPTGDTSSRAEHE
jgi:hypothetical protein